MSRKLEQHEIANLWALLDGKLDAARAEQVRGSIEADHELGGAYAQMRRLDAILNDAAAPAPSTGLANRIVASVRQAGRETPMLIRVVRLAAPLAAAAALIVACIVYYAPKSHPAGLALKADPAASPQASPATASLEVELRKQAETLAASNPDFFADMDVLTQYDTLQAIEKLEAEGEGT